MNNASINQCFLLFDTKLSKIIHNFFSVYIHMPSVKKKGFGQLTGITRKAGNS